MSGRPTKECEQHKGLKPKLHDYATNEELQMTVLAKLSTKRVWETWNPRSLPDQDGLARLGRGVVKEAREAEVEDRVVRQQNARKLFAKSTRQEDE